MLQVFGLMVVVVSMMILVGAPKTIMAYLSEESMARMENDSLFNDLGPLKDLIFSDEAKANQKIADEKEAAQIKQYGIDAQMKANGTMPTCREGESPLSKWMKTPKSINEDGTVDFPPIFESCVKPVEEFKGAIILFK